MDLLDRCLAASGRKYPSGYGFALAYLDDHLNPAHLRDAACAIVAEAYGVFGKASDRKDSDLVAFVDAYANAKSAEGYLIEAAQLLLSYGMAKHPIAMNALALAGHPGYDVTEATRPAGPDAYYVELVDEDNARHWSDVMLYDGDRPTLIEASIGMASCEMSYDPAKLLRFYPLKLDAPAFVAPFVEIN